MPNDRGQNADTAEQSRRLAEDGRQAAELTRVAAENGRIAAEIARQQAMADLHATADSLESSLEHMQVVEDMRRELREIRDLNKLDSN